jgi:hypothetical protein
MSVIWNRSKEGVYIYSYSVESIEIKRQEAKNKGYRLG